MERTARMLQPPSHGRARRKIDLLQRLNRALSDQVRREIGQSRFASDGRVAAWQDLLVPGVDPALLGPRSAELSRPRFAQPASPAVVAVNSFLNWRACPGELGLVGRVGFSELHLDARLPTGVRGTPPLLDALALREREVVAVTAQGLGSLEGDPAALAQAYAELSLPDGMRPWAGLMQGLRARPGQFRHVDAAFLVKGAIGLNRTFPHRQAHLLYLFLEPAEPARHEVFAAHRAELAELVARTTGGLVELHAQSFEELWSSWEALSAPAWLRGVVSGLRSRYTLAATH